MFHRQRGHGHRQFLFGMVAPRVQLVGRAAMVGRSGVRSLLRASEARTEASWFGGTSPTPSTSLVEVDRIALPSIAAFALNVWRLCFAGPTVLHHARAWTLRRAYDQRRGASCTSADSPSPTSIGLVPFRSSDGSDSRTYRSGQRPWRGVAPTSVAMSWRAITGSLSCQGAWTWTSSRFVSVARCGECAESSISCRSRAA